MLRPLIAVVDGPGAITHWSESCAEWTGWSWHAVRGRQLSDVLALPVDRGSSLPAQFQIESAPSIVWTSSLLGRSGERAPTLVMGIDRLERERARAGSHRSLQLPGDRIPMWAFDRGTLAVIAVNQAAARAYDISAEALTRLRVLDLFRGDALDRLLDTLVDLAAEVVWSGPWRQRGPSGAFDADLGMIASEDAGQPTGVALVSSHATASLRLTG